MAGCQILPNDHIFNTRVDNLPVSPHSQEYMARIPNSPVAYYPAWGINIADRDTPKEKMHFAYTPQNDGVFEMVPWPYLKRESGVFSNPRSGEDRHVLTVDRDTCEVFEIYNNYPPGTNPQCSSCTAQSGVHYGSMDTNLPSGSVDAAGMLLAPLTLRLREVRSGAIQHALRVTLKNSIIGATEVWPARTHAGAWGKIPYGTRFRLRKSYDISKFSPLAQVLLKQLQEYGLILADGGSNWDVNTCTDVTEDPRVEAAIREVGGRGPRSNDFEVVDESSLMTSRSSGKINAASPYLKAESSAAAGTRGNATSSARAVTVGTPDPSIWVQSGVSKRMTAWVNGTTDRRVKWSMEPALGTLSADGVYTAPDVPKPATTMLTAASAADPNAKTTVALTVLPKGTIRVDIGDATLAPNTPHSFAPDYGPDSEGHMWWRDMAGEVSWGVVHDYWQGGWADAPGVKDIGLYYTSRYSLGDMVYSFTVPNGNYKITILFAEAGCPFHKTFDPNNEGPIKLEAQGQIVADNYEWGRPINYACRTPTSTQIPAQVTNGSLYFALRRMVDSKHKSVPILSGYSIERDTSAPHITLDPPNPGAITMSQKLQFNAVAWYMNKKAVTWSIQGPGSISPNGLYQAPDTPPKGEQTVIVQAKSVADPKLTATAEMKFGFGPMTISPATVTIDRSLSQKFTASINGAAYNGVTWSISPNVGQISPDGVYTAPDSLPADAQITVKATSTDDASQSSTANLVVKASTQTIRVNCGDTGGFKDAQGNVWAADHAFHGPTNANHAPKQIAGASQDMQPLYQSSRYCYANQKFYYEFPVPNGRYAVTLMFADYSWNDPGHYIFDVSINGNKVLSNFDLQKGYPPRTAINKRYETTVTDKSIRIDFAAHQASAIINGIEIQYLGP